MVTWFGFWLYRGIIPRSCQGHIKVTGKSNQLIIGENCLFLLVLFQFSSLKMSRVVETQLDPSMEINQNTPISYRVNIRARGVLSHQITLMSPLSHMTGMDQISR